MILSMKGVSMINDICRCLDKGCLKKEQCKRWIYRENGGERTPYCESFRKDDQECDFFMEEEDE